MHCPYCGHPEGKVLDTRTLREGSAIRRRRECLGCGRRYTTYEYVEISPLMVIKRDGRREPFSREKLKRGIVFAVAERPIPGDKVEDIVGEIEELCVEKGNSEISSQEIGEMVMDKLRALDEIAYIRFASVYRRFQDLGEFRRELEQIKPDR
ncbi:MAG: transcriptional regulator NrdR [bacterium]